MAGIARNGQKCLIFIVVPLLRIENSGKLFHREGPTNEIAFCPMFDLRKGIFKFFKFISCIFSTLWSKFKNSFQKIKTDVIHIFECNSVYTLINSFAGM